MELKTNYETIEKKFNLCSESADQPGSSLDELWQRAARGSARAAGSVLGGTAGSAFAARCARVRTEDAYGSWER